jgi:CRP-like cAMP-binding protein
MASLSSIPFFKDATDFDPDSYARRVAWKKFDAGQIVVDFEDRSDDVYFLVSGDVRILVRTAGGKEVILTDMHGGQYFGELAAIDATPRSANVTALTRCEMCIVPGSVFRDLIGESRVLNTRIMHLLARRVRDLNERIIEHTVLDIRHRLYAELLRQSQPRSGNANERIVSPPPYHHVLAGRVGCRREQITRELSTMTVDGLIEKTRGGVVIKEPQKLKERIAAALREAS